MKYTYKQLSSYRREIMGLAIFLIMFCHNTISLPGAIGSANSGLMMLGQSGVDIFFFISGFGCYYSMKKDSNPVSFYKRRLTKLVPPYLLVVAIYGLFCVLVEKQALSEYLSNYSLISFYTVGDLHEWFIASILLVYLVYPFVFRLIEKDKNDKAVKIILAILYVFLILYACRLFRLHKPFATIAAIFIVRVPAFLFGSLFAKRSIEGKEISTKFVRSGIVIGILAGIVCLVLYKVQIKHYWMIIRMLFLLVGFAVMFLWITSREKSSGKRPVPTKPVRFFTYIGPITLELYLLHEKMLAVLNRAIGQFDPPGILINIIAIVLSIFIAKRINKLFTNLSFA